MNRECLHRLIGIEPDNLLGFLALMGTMRALQVAKAAWRVRVYWEVEHPPVHPVLSTSEPVERNELLDVIVGGCDLLAADHDFGGQRKLAWSQSYARRLLHAAIPRSEGPRRRAQDSPDEIHRGRADVLAALVSDAAAWKGRVTATPLCLQYGQGHQYFLDRFAAVPRTRCAPARGTGAALAAPTAQQTLERALFHPWERKDMSPAFRWDPEEDRRYALRFGNPSAGGVPTVHGANRLAALGLPLFTVVPRAAGSKVRLAMIASRVNARREVEISWPIWTRPVSLEGVRALLNAPLILQPEVDNAQLGRLSVYEVRRATRIKVGEFFNMTRAGVVPAKIVTATTTAAA
jgi:hypothetical protein